VVPIVDRDDKVQVLKAMGMDSIAALGATNVPADIEKRFPQAKGWGNKLARPASDVKLLIGMDN
jgi:glycine cleavage system pyridoxal-binding protein P